MSAEQRRRFVGGMQNRGQRHAAQAGSSRARTGETDDGFAAGNIAVASTGRVSTHRAGCTRDRQRSAARQARGTDRRGAQSSG